MGKSKEKIFKLQASIYAKVLEMEEYQLTELEGALEDVHVGRAPKVKTVTDFIQKYTFPGGALPSCGALLSSVSRVTDLQLTNLHDIGLDYARTLQIWREAFLQRLQEVRQLGYPDEFVRMWEWYLAYCEGGFLERAISAVQVVFDKPDCRLQPQG